MSDFETHPVGTAKELRILRYVVDLMIQHGYEKDELPADIIHALKDAEKFYMEQLYLKGKD
jgi:hypothetical protein